MGRLYIHGLFTENTQRGGFEVMSILIKDTTKEEREECVTALDDSHSAL